MNTRSAAFSWLAGLMVLVALALACNIGAAVRDEPSEEPPPPEAEEPAAALPTEEQAAEE